MQFIQELQAEHIMAKGLPQAVVQGFDAKQLKTTAETLGFEEPEFYLTRHTPKKGKDKNVECVYLVIGGHWERLCQGTEVDRGAVKEKFDQLTKLATALACLM